MRFRGKIDLWFWFVMLLGEGIVLTAILASEEKIWGILIGVFYNIIFLPFIIRNYVEVSDETVTVVFGFSKQSIACSKITEVYRTWDPVSSTAASLDRIVLKGDGKSIICAVQKREEFLELLKEKNVPIDDSERKKTSKSKWGMIICICVIGLVGVLLFTGNITYEYGTDSFVIRASYWPDREILYKDITQITYTEETVDGRRVSGFGSFRLQMGDFKNQEFGKYKRYTYTRCDGAVILTVKGNKMVLSGKEQEDTKELYTKLLQHLNEESVNENGD